MARARRRRTHRVMALLLAAGGVAIVSSWRITAQSQGVAWERARETVGRFRTMIDSSGLVEVGSNIPPNIRRDDLQSLCEGRKEAIVRARQKGEQDLRTLIPGDDPITAEQRGVIERYLGSVASFTGDADEAVRHFQAG